jgi:hypothetical protein
VIFRLPRLQPFELFSGRRERKMGAVEIVLMDIKLPLAKLVSRQAQIAIKFFGRSD